MYYTILIDGFTRQHGPNGGANGGVTLVQVGRSASGWRKRHVDDNGRHESRGPSEAVTRDRVEELIRVARMRADDDQRHGRWSSIDHGDLDRACDRLGLS